MGMKVLIIEDDSIVAMHIRETVQGHDHEVIGVAKNADRALKMAEKNHPDLVISDINLEGRMDGIACSKLLQKMYSSAVVLITAYNDLETLKNASTLNFLGYLIKPFREDELLTLIDLVALRGKSQEKTNPERINQTYSYCSRQQTLFRGQEVIELTQKENSFLEALIKANGAIVPYNHFSHMIWDGEEVSDEARRQLVYRFRQKLPDFPFKLIKGMGYKLEREG